ncbi:MAG: hypothetical protein BWX86_02951 [Verrucomicrobia bacterium ADurb.Bin122]|nr:MAG: hypothetical protein BWX86_02951 [Verrucomicrobia bacterium ADurb.Bin122]
MRLLERAESWVFAPALMFAPLRANDAEPGIAPKRLLPILARPMDTSSWFESRRWPDLAASVLPIEIASSMPRMATASAAPISGGTTCQSPDSRGIPLKDGSTTASAPSSPIVRMPSSCSPKKRLMTAINTSPSSSAGILGTQRSKASNTSSESTPIAAAGMLKSRCPRLTRAAIRLPRKLPRSACMPSKCGSWLAASNRPMAVL